MFGRFHKTLAGGGFEWDDDFTSPAPAFLPKTDKEPVSKVIPSTTPAVGRVLEPSWSSSSAYSRFSISPASIASFSLTHLTDSDIEQGGKSMLRLKIPYGHGKKEVLSLSFTYQDKIKILVCSYSKIFKCKEAEQITQYYFLLAISSLLPLPSCKIASQ